MTRCLILLFHILYSSVVCVSSLLLAAFRTHRPLSLCDSSFLLPHLSPPSLRCPSALLRVWKRLPQSGDLVSPDFATPLPVQEPVSYSTWPYAPEESNKVSSVMEIHADGACSNNGKPNARGGVGIYFGDNDHRNISAPLQGPVQTNQRAELTAVRDALKIAPNRQLSIYTDSEYAIRCSTDWKNNWKQNGWKTQNGKPVQNQDLIRDIDSLVEQRQQNVEFHHVPAHRGVRGNEEADRLARRGITRHSGNSQHGYDYDSY